ncbi:amino acid adenylation domain-containing protein, partial [Myxococcota bacterium]|nr:amino acid adenylation domain-containing protein [Myxococcota bacterium]
MTEPAPSGLSANKRQLLELLKQKRAAQRPERRIPRRADDAPRPLSFAQERLWFLSQLEPDSTAYNIRRVLEILGPLDVRRLEDALGRLVARHEVLRSRYPASAGRPRAEVTPPGRFRLAELDLAELGDDERTLREQALVDEELARPFDLAEGPLFRATLLKSAAERHLLLLSMHHIVSDGWSLGLLFRELADLYRGTGLPELGLQYSDYAAWQRDRDPAHVDAGLAFWRRELEGVGPLELPVDHPRPAVLSTRGARAPIELPVHLTEALEGLAASSRATPFMALLAAIEVLLARSSGQRDFAIGTPVAGRGEPETEPLIGCFVNTIVLRTDLGGDPTFRELIERVQRRTVAAFAHQDTPFERLVEVLAPDRDLARAPLFQVMFVLRNTLADQPPALPGLSVRQVDVDPRTSQLDLGIYLGNDPTNPALRGYVEYSTELFEASTIERLVRHLGVLLEGAIASPDTPVSRLPLLTDAERRQAVFEWNDTYAEYPRHLAVGALISAQAARTPDVIAAVCGERSITYAELEHRTNQLANHLIRRGAGPGAVVGVGVERSIEMLVALVAVMKSGAAYVPLDPAFPRARLDLMISDSKMALIVTQDTLAFLFSVPVVRVDADAAVISAAPATPPPAVDPESIAYVLYTSGSTGRPKGVEVRHRSVVNFLCSMTEAPGLSADDVLVAVTTISFDIAGLELYLPLVTGARVVIASREAASDGAQLLALLERSRATVLQATPATWKMMILAGWTRSPRLRALVGGEALPSRLALDLLGRVAELWNLYGPTETTIWSSIERLDASLLRGRETAPIGRPIANTELHVLDASLEPVPVGVHGELYIGGDGVARGYLGRPELTAERFVHDPFRAARGALVGGTPGLLYRTGDIARRRLDGRVEYVGRVDNQVKLRGFRIELGEIEAVLARHPLVAEAVAIVREDKPGDQRLVAYLRTKSGEAPEVTELRTLARERLPEYMVPSVFVPLSALPLTPNGKIDRRALPAPEARDTADLAPTFQGPETPVQEALANMFAEVLGKRRVGIHDDFFALGGHSLLATQLLARIREGFAVELPLRALFESPTVAGLERHVEPARGSPPAVRPIERVSREEELPLSFPQQRIWFLDQFEGETGAYNVPVALRLSGTVDVEALDAALASIVRRHEVLRTTFPVVDGQPRQRIGDAPATLLQVVRLDAASVDAPEVKQWITREA